MLHAYVAEGKRKGLKICTAFAKGARGEVVRPGVTRRLLPGPAMFYGWAPSTMPLFDEARRDGRDWYYADNAYYFGRGEFFRVTRGAFQHDGNGDAGPERFERFGIEVKPWRNGGRHVLVTTQSDLWHRQWCGMSQEQWAEMVVAEIRRHTDRPVDVCHKPSPCYGAHDPSFESRLDDAWAVVTHSSSTGVKALLEGVPVFSLAPSCLSVMGSADLAEIEAPRRPDGREQWAWNLAANQWTLAEIEDGTCWREIGR